MNNSSLSQTAVKGMLWASLEKFGGRAIQFVSSLILARLLSTEDFGLIGMIVIVFAIANTMVDSGFGQALIREKELSENDKATTFYFNFFISLFLFVVIWLLSPAISAYYEEDILVDLTRLMALTPLFLSFTIVQRSYFAHRINFRTQAYINLLASLGSGAIAIYLALEGWGVWALGIQYVSMSLFTSILFWYANPWVPKGFINGGSFKKLFGFGSKLMVSGLIHVIFTHVYKVIIGKLYTKNLLGLYHYAENLKNAVSDSLISVIARVNYSALSKVKDDRERLIEAYKKIIRVSSYIIFPAIFGLILVAKPFVVTLIGIKWIEIVPILQLLCLAGLIHHLQVINLEILKVLGRSDLFLKLEIIKKAGVTVAILVGLEFGFWGLIIAQIISSYVSLFINMTYTAKLLGYTRFDQLKDVVVVLILSIPMIMGVYLASTIDFNSLLLELVILVLLGVLIYFTTSYLFKPQTYKDTVYLLRPKFKFLKYLNV